MGVALVGVGVGVALVGVGVALVGVGVGFETPTTWISQVAAAPLMSAVQLVGFDIAFAVSLNPNDVDAVGLNDPFHETFAAVSFPLDVPPEAFHNWVVPFHGVVTDHDAAAVEPVFVTVASTVRPVPQSLEFFSTTFTALLPAVGVAVGLALGWVGLGEAEVGLGEAEVGVGVGDALVGVGVAVVGLGVGVGV